MNTNQTTTDPTCTECGTTEDVITESHEGVTIQMCQDCLDAAVEEIMADWDAECQAEADAYDGASTSREELSPDAQRLKDAVDATYRAFLEAGYSYLFKGEPKVWDAGDYRDGGPPTFTLAISQERLSDMEAFFESNEEFHERFPTGIQARLDGVIEWHDYSTFEYYSDA